MNELISRLTAARDADPDVGSLRVTLLGSLPVQVIEIVAVRDAPITESSYVLVLR